MGGLVGGGVGGLVGLSVCGTLFSLGKEGKFLIAVNGVSSFFEDPLAPCC